MKWSKLDRELAQTLYDAGKTDGEIAAAAGVTRQTIARWRGVNHLPPNRQQGSTLHGGMVRTNVSESDVLEMHDAGASDSLIAQRTGVYRERVAGVREEAGLASNYTKCLPEDVLQEAYDAGCHDAEIARRACLSDSTVAAWRSRNNLPPHRCTSRGPIGPDHGWDRGEAERLYALGLPDTRIAAQVGVSPTTIRKWRIGKGFPVQVRRPFSETDIERLYHEGLNDSEIAAKLGISAGPVGEWRRSCGLPRNCMELDTEAAKTLWEQGRNDSQTARALGTTRAVVRKWRTKSGLPSHRPIKLNESKARELYDSGKNDCEIARELDCTSGTIWQWRQRNGLAAVHGKHRE